MKERQGKVKEKGEVKLSMKAMKYLVHYNEFLI